MEWRAVLGYERQYEINDIGQIHSKLTGKFLKPYRGDVYLRSKGETRSRKVFEVLCESFGYDPQDCYPKDGDIENATVSNIGSASEFRYISDSEEWKYIPGYEGYYQASVDGKIRSVDRVVPSTRASCKIQILRKGCEMKQYTDLSGYRHVGLSKHGEVKLLLVHRIIATAFIPNPENKSQVNHKDGDKCNNCADNLEWVTRSENMQHAKLNGLWDPYWCGKQSQMTSGRPVICTTTGEVFPSISSAAAKFNMDHESVKDSIRLSKPRKGHRFQYLDSEGGD